MSILKNFVNPWEADRGVLETNVLETDVLNTEVLGGNSKKTQIVLPPSPKFFQIIRVEKVRNLTREEYFEETLKGREKTFDNKLKLRNKRLAETDDWDKNNNEIKTAVSNLSNRWNLYQLKLYGKLMDRMPVDAYGVPILDFNDIFYETDELVNEDLQDISKLTSRYSTIKDEVINSHKAYENLKRAIQEEVEERYEFKRFDDFYNNEILKSILDAVPNITFVPAEIKALNAQETGDFTITTINGLANKSKGITNNNIVNANYKGLGHHGTGASEEAIKWAKTKNIIIPENPDPRFEPETAIYLTGAYLGYIIEKHLLRYLPKPIPEDIELKKLAFASYNWTHTKVISKVKNLGNKKNYTWDDIKNVSPAETRTYISRITSRLTLKG